MSTNQLPERLRKVIAEIRRKPYPISDLIPLLSEAADALQVTTPQPSTAPDLACKSVQARLAAQWGYVRPAPGVPDGYALVPTEPTEEMLLAYTGGAITDAGFRWCRHQWSAMLAAAQAQKGQP